jgi:Lon protease-like protein
MHKPFDLSKELEAFTGQVAIFPLPNVVLFPHLLLPLHIFEPRYRAMVADALDDNRLIAMALLKPGEIAERKDAGIHGMVCIGRITAEQRLPDGGYYLVVHGLSRGMVTQEPDLAKPYRVARLRLCDDRDPETFEREADEWRRRLLQEFRGLHPCHELDRLFRRALCDQIPLGLLSDVLADAMGLDPQIAQQVLEETDVERRCRLVLRLIHEKARCRSGPVGVASPAQFSLN